MRNIMSNILKKKISEFKLTGKAIVNNYIFKTDQKSTNDWIWNSLTLGVEINKNNIIRTEMMGGYGENSENDIYVCGTKLNENGELVDDFKNRFTIDWKTRNTPYYLRFVSDNCFIHISIEKDYNGNLIHRKFLSEYDAVLYLQKHLKHGMKINVEGFMRYVLYKGEVYTRNDIRNISLAEVDKKNKAEFKQTILVHKDSVGQDKSYINANVVDYSKEDKRYVLMPVEFYNTTSLDDIIKKGVGEFIVEGDLIESTERDNYNYLKNIKKMVINKII